MKTIFRTHENLRRSASNNLPNQRSYVRAGFRIDVQDNGACLGHACLHRTQNGGLPDGDVLVHAGDFMNSGYDPRGILSFDYWLGEQPFKYRVVCAGNHDRYFQNSPRDARFLLNNAIYLENAGVTIDNVTFWGSPYTPEFLDWVFMYPRGSGAKQHWDQIHYGLDVLISHGPPLGILDQVAPSGKHLGCAELLEAVDQGSPRCISLAIFTAAPGPLRAEPLAS